MRLASLIALALLLAPPLVRAETTQGADQPAAPMHEQVLRLPGDPRRPVTLEVTLFTPDGPGPFPLAVMNHGSTEPGQSPADMPRYRRSFEAWYFLSRGYAVALPMLRGFAGSGGRLELAGCDAARLGLQNARDIAAVLDALGREPNIDASRVVVAGQSLGGWNTLALGTMAGPAVKGLINFAGGERESDCHDQERALVEGAQTYGRQTRIPSLWLYGDNDSHFPPSLWRAMYDRYLSAGGPAELVAYGTFGDDSHHLAASGESLAVWTPKLDAFLGRVGLPNKAIYPLYLPSPPPPPSHFAAIDDLGAIPYLDAGAKAYYRKFLDDPKPRAFVISPGMISSQTGGFDPVACGLAACRARSPGCGVYAYDDYVAWTGPKATPAGPSDVQETVAAGATAVLNFAYAVNLDCSSRGLARFRVTAPPAHGAAAAVPSTGFPKFAPGSPYLACNKMRVPGLSLTYTPVAGFTGADALTVEEVTVDGDEKLYRLAITVK